MVVDAIDSLNDLEAAYASFKRMYSKAWQQRNSLASAITCDKSFPIPEQESVQTIVEGLKSGQSSRPVVVSSAKGNSYSLINIVIKDNPIIRFSIQRFNESGRTIGSGAVQTIIIAREIYSGHEPRIFCHP